MKERRILVSKIMLSLSVVSAFVGVSFLFWILYTLIVNGLGGLSLDLFKFDGAPPGSPNSGLRHAIIGQLILTFFTSIIGVPIGVLAGTYLNEYAKDSKIASFLRHINDIMMSSPSIVIGIFVYAVLVENMGNFSAYAGIASLCIIMIPVILRTTDDMLNLVPNSLREAAYALGATKATMIITVVYRGAKFSIFTGIILAISRIVGETAPLLFTSFNNNFFSLNMNEPIASLTVTMFNYATSPYEDWQKIGWAAAFLLSFFVLGLNVFGKCYFKEKKK